MKVQELIQALQTQPQDAEIGVVYDGVVRGDVIVVYLAQSGKVVLGGSGGYVGRPEDKPYGYKGYGHLDMEKLV